MLKWLARIGLAKKAWDWYKEHKRKKERDEQTFRY